jgi:hypothetical protein
MSHATGNEEVSGTERSGTAPQEPETVQEDNLGSLGDPGHTFDQTNGLVDGLEGNTDGFAEDNDQGDGIDGDDNAVPLIAPENR